MACCVDLELALAFLGCLLYCCGLCLDGLTSFGGNLSLQELDSLCHVIENVVLLTCFELTPQGLDLFFEAACPLTDAVDAANVPF